MTTGEQEDKWDDDDGSRGGVLPEYFAFRRVSREQEPHTHTYTHTQARGYCMHFTTSLRVLILYISIYFRMCTSRRR